MTKFSNADEQIGHQNRIADMMDGLDRMQATIATEAALLLGIGMGDRAQALVRALDALRLAREDVASLMKL